jgi:hypothetical protein
MSKGLKGLGITALVVLVAGFLLVLWATREWRVWCQTAPECQVRQAAPQSGR